MAEVKEFSFNPFQENTFVIFDDTKECILIDPGCYFPAEEQQLTDFIEQKGLKPVRLILTHCHLDHIFGNHFIQETYGLKPEFHQADLPVFEAFMSSAEKYGVPVKASPTAERFIETDEIITFGKSQMKALFAPGHSPGSLCYYFEAEGFLIAGDVLFRQSIGRTDLLGGDYDTLINSIKNQLMTLPDTTKVYAGHGHQTNIGFERANNPFLQ